MLERQPDRYIRCKQRQNQRKNAAHVIVPLCLASTVQEMQVCLGSTTFHPTGVGPKRCDPRGRNNSQPASRPFGTPQVYKPSRAIFIAKIQNLYSFNVLYNRVHMQEFEKRYAALNVNQKKAVDTLDGPIMVVAGPGTGKTELLSVRVANILQKTDALPQNILCLTFTDSGTVAMRERLAELLGQDAYKVAIHTFHSFGSEIINRYGEYFYQGAHFRPADELASYELLSGILEQLPHDNPLSSKLNDSFTYLRDIQTSISELKRGGFTPDELDSILTRNDTFIAWLKPKLAAIFSTRTSKKTLPALNSLTSEIEAYEGEPLELPGYHPLNLLIAHSLTRAVETAEADNSTRPITGWKNTYIEKDAQGAHTLKDERRSEKLHALSGSLLRLSARHAKSRAIRL